MHRYEGNKAAELLKELPKMDARQNMMLTKNDIQELKGLNNAPELTKTTMALWLLLLDSFGVEMTAKSKSIIQEALKAAGSFRAKA